MSQASSLGGRRSSAGGVTTPVRYPPLYDVMTYVQDFSWYFDRLQFSMLLQAGLALCILFGPGLHDTAARAWCRSWRPLRRRGAPTLKTGCPERDPLPVCCR